MLVFEVDAAGIDHPTPRARRCEVRLVGSVRDSPGDTSNGSRAGDLSAVLVLRALTPSRLLSCVRTLTSGGAPVEAVEWMPADIDGDEDSDETTERRLTRRELEVLRLLAEGDSTRDIAQRLSYSERTVKNIVHDLLVKLNCRTRAHAVALAARQGVI